MRDDRRPRDHVLCRRRLKNKLSGSCAAKRTRSTRSSCRTSRRTSSRSATSQEVHGDQFEQIGRVIDKYRYPDYRTRRQLHETRVLIVRGVRGSGKTHLLHVLRQRTTPTPEIWVCPRYYDPAFPFAEYLLTEFVRDAAVVGGSRGPGSLALVCPRADAAAAGRGGRVAEPVRMAAVGRCLPRAAGARRGGPRVVRRTGKDCWASSARAPARRRWAKSAAVTGCRLAAASGLVMRHVERTELGTGAAVRMRREVLLAFSELALRNTPDRLASLLEQDFAQPDAALPPARAEVVTQLLQTSAEVLAAVGVPIIFALDNMERLLAPRGPVDMPAAQSFFNGLAHVLDQTRGLLVMLFVERGLWNEFGQAINTFADHRLRQGVRVRDYGCVWDLELTPPTPDQIEQVVQRRMSPLLARAPHADQLPPCFPFSSEEVREIATAGVDVLRTALLRLRDRYDELVLPDEPAGPDAGGLRIGRRRAQASAADEAADALRRTWDEAAATGRRRLVMSRRTSLAQELHTGLGRWLELLRRPGRQRLAAERGPLRRHLRGPSGVRLGHAGRVAGRARPNMPRRLGAHPGRRPVDAQGSGSQVLRPPAAAGAGRSIGRAVAGPAGARRSPTTAACDAADLGTVGGRTPGLAVPAADDRFRLVAWLSRVAGANTRRRRPARHRSAASSCNGPATCWPT